MDIARFGDDSTVLTVRKGLHCYKPAVYRGLDTMQATDVLINAIRLQLISKRQRKNHVLII
jgi:hypothetical protein